MGDSVYSEFPSETGNIDTVKQEPADCLTVQQEMATSSASVPIPGTHRSCRTTYDQFSPSPLTNPSIWGMNHPADFSLGSPSKLEIQDPLDPGFSFKMDDDDIFQVDKADLIQGPTLAELNANEDTLLGDLNFDDLLLPNDNLQPMRSTPFIDIPVSNSFSIPSANTVGSSSFPQTLYGYRSYSHQCNSSTSGLGRPAGVNNPTEISTSSMHSRSGANNLTGSYPENSSLIPGLVIEPVSSTTLQELLLKKDEINSLVYDQMKVSCISTKPKISRLSMSAPTQSMGIDQIWERREPRQHLLSTGSLGPGEAESTSSLSTGSALSPNLLGHLEPLSHDEGYEDSDEDSDHYDDCSSDNESEGSDNDDQIAVGKMSVESLFKDGKQKKEKYFWQYNVQAKGPKGQRLVARTRLENPHVLNEATDPVFSPNCSLRGIKHSGKARKGDGNDLTPNPRKLHNIGKELEKLSNIINDMTPVSELPFPVRPKTRKEKNKLASRACRLKKKAQHEANKIKLHGLEQEHKRLIHGITQAKQILTAKLTETNSEVQEDLSRQMERVFKNATKIKIANHSTEFVNKVLDKVKAGVPDGGIDEF